MNTKKYEEKENKEWGEIWNVPAYKRAGPSEGEIKDDHIRAEVQDWVEENRAESHILNR